MSIRSEKSTLAQVSVEVKKFHLIGGDHSFSKADILVTDDGGGAVQQPGGVNTPIVVNSEANIQFNVTDASGATGTYVPVGIGFKEGNPEDPIGMAAFPDRTIECTDGKTTLTLTDAHPGENSFEFGIIIERSRDGGLSVIDPKIQNTSYD